MKYLIMDSVVDNDDEWLIFVKDIGNIYIPKENAPEQLDVEINFHYLTWDGSEYGFSARGN